MCNLFKKWQSDCGCISKPSKNSKNTIPMDDIWAISSRSEPSQGHRAPKVPLRRCRQPKEAVGRIEPVMLEAHRQ